MLHYTAVDCEKTLAIFQDSTNQASAHLVIDTNGDVHELVRCLDGEAWRAWHAGVSRLNGSEAFNDHAIGIELVNFNGNLFPYSDAQYQSLQEVVSLLKQQYPALNHPERVIGHEHIAGFRGKADPGLCFDWPRFYHLCYPGITHPERRSVCPPELRDRLTALSQFQPDNPKERNRFWEEISVLTESFIRQLHA